MNNLMVLHGEYQPEQMSVSFTSPTPFPSSVLPIVADKKASDFRKILIEGFNQSNLTLAENLRRFGYEGNIGIISDEDNQEQIDTNFITKNQAFKSTVDHLLQRSREFIRERIRADLFGFGFISKIRNSIEHHSFVQLENSQKLLYDVLVLGRKEISEEEEILAKIQNLIILKDFSSLEKSKSLLKESNKIVIINLAYNSLELFSTLKSLYREKEFTLLNTDDANIIERDLGD